VLEGGCGRLVYCIQNLDGGGAAWEFCPCSTLSEWSSKGRIEGQVHDYCYLYQSITYLVNLVHWCLPPMSYCKQIVEWSTGEVRRYRNYKSLLTKSIEPSIWRCRCSTETLIVLYCYLLAPNSVISILNESLANQ
jgi:hypothetical protein